jgi:hypothetical protein
MLVIILPRVPLIDEHHRAGRRYEDGTTECVIDRTPLPLPVLPGLSLYDSSGRDAIESWLAEGGVDERVRGISVRPQSGEEPPVLSGGSSPLDQGGLGIALRLSG